ncbi:hypothetical protein [Wenxinia marina]|nr:hypothetical protein [Wenxinia marina]GGL66086.1 hypothetical protein GCM10011392_20900 [Wenxinia marina]
MAIWLLQGAAFLAWAALMFRTLFLLRRRAADRTGAMFPGPLTFLAEVRIWLRDPGERGPRRALSLVTLALIGLTGLNAAAMP